LSPRVLVVDDEPAILHAIERALRRRGIDVVVAADARSALEALDAAPMDAVLLDVRLPGPSGTAVGGEIARRWPHLRNRLIFMSGDPSTAIDQLPVAFRDTPVLPKPFELQRLFTEVQTILDRVDTESPPGSSA
jgi:DNA-binding NtrC family response regulator